MERIWTNVRHSGHTWERFRDMAEQVKSTWYAWIPGWLPVCACICGAAMWVGQYTAHMNDRLDNLEKQVQRLQDYMYQAAPRKNPYNTEEQRYDQKQQSDGFPQYLPNGRTE